MAEILRSLSGAPLWRDVIATFTDHCIKQLPFQLKHTNIFTLLVLVGIPQVRLFGGWATSSHPPPARQGLCSMCLGEFPPFRYMICMYRIAGFSRLWDGLSTAFLTG